MSHPSTHRSTSPFPPLAPDSQQDWTAWSQAWTRHVPILTGRTDLHVHVAPGAAGDAPECFYPALRRIEVDANYIADNPEIADPAKAAHKRVVPTGYGLLVHGAAHATHSLWTTPSGTAPILAQVADLLEESRAEGRQRARRRGDRRWLRSTVTALLDPGDAPVDDVWHAGQLAALLLARVDARILTSKDVKGVRAAVTGVLGRKRLRKLREVWRQAHAVADTDADSMIALAERWCRILGINPHQQWDAPAADAGEFGGRLAQALADYLAVQYGLTPSGYAALLLEHRHSPPADWTRTEPTAGQQQAARHLAARLRRARTHNPEPGSRASLIPPGRLRARAAITADAQAAAGQVPTAAPWTQRVQLPPPKQTLHLAVLVDLSGSMQPYATELSQAAWMFAHAAHNNGAVTTTIGFGNRTTVLTAPRQRPTHILNMQAWGGTITFPEAVKVADRLLDLRNGRTLRLLAVVSDGDLADIGAAQKLITTLHRAGCAVLWIRPADMDGHTFTHTTTVTVADPVDAVTQIADAAVTVLETA